MDEIFIIIGLILLNGVFAMAEIALVSARKSSLQEDAKRGNKAAKTALNLADEPDKFLSTVQIGITLIGILTGIYSGNKIALLLSDKIHAMGLSESYSAS
jgi:putative hemolysin